MQIENNSQYVFLTLQVPVEIRIEKISSESDNEYLITADCNVNTHYYRAGIYSIGEIDAVQKREIINRLQQSLIEKIKKYERINEETQLCN